MARFKIVDGVKIQFTEAEEIARNAEEETEAVKLQNKKNVETEIANKKASGKQKLKDLGLDDDEIKALMGV